MIILFRERTAIADIVKMENMKFIADCIDTDLSFTDLMYDIEANNEDKRMPILDLKVWMEKVSHQRYLILHGLIHVNL